MRTYQQALKELQDVDTQISALETKREKLYDEVQALQVGHVCEWLDMNYAGIRTIRVTEEMHARFYKHTPRAINRSAYIGANLIIEDYSDTTVWAASDGRSERWSIPLDMFNRAFEAQKTTP